MNSVYKTLHFIPIFWKKLYEFLLTFLTIIYTYFDNEYSEMENICGINLNPDDFNNTYYPSVIVGEGRKIVLINNTVPAEIPKVTI